jgi:hypothetical protein
MKVPVTVFGFTALFIIAVTGQRPSLGSPARRVTIQGCLSGQPGSLLVNDQTSGRTYKIQGEPQKLGQRIGKAIRAQGEEATLDQGHSSLDVKDWTPAGDCKR